MPASIAPAATPVATVAAANDWWRRAVIYQVYPRSFADSNGDGVGDLAGLRASLSYLTELGVDAIWITPWYASPLKDGGYDVADYRSIHPDLGTLADAEALIAEAGAVGIRTIIDVVPNHVSSAHRWFVEALAAGPGSPARSRFWFRPGRGADGGTPPNDWESEFRGDTWTRTTTGGDNDEWYLHLFTADQPDLNWSHPDVRAEHEAVLRFWFDRGVAGVRIDSAALLAKDERLPELPAEPAAGTHPYVDREEVHEVYRSWRRLADAYPEPKLLVGEVWLPEVARFAQYLRPDELHTAFNFDFMTRPWDATALRASIDATLASHRPVGAPPTWVLSNHDVTRPVTRFGRADTAFAFATKRFGTPTDLALGGRRARAAALLSGALPGSLYIYQGDELGLPEVEVPREAICDPMHFRSGGIDPGRDGCRVPLPWTATGPNFGFGPTGANPWLPQPPEWGRYAVATQLADPDSMLTLYRSMLRLRREEPALATDEFCWVDHPDASILHFRRGCPATAQLDCLVNLGTGPVPVPTGFQVVLSSQPIDSFHVEPDAAVWLRPITAQQTTGESQ
jgi:alpha-glucosidase